MRIEECRLHLCRTTRNDDSVLESFVKERTAIEFKKEKVAERIDGWKEKPLHGQYPKKVQESETHSWNWLKARWLKKETEGILLATHTK